MASPAFYRSTSRDAEAEVEIHSNHSVFLRRRKKEKERLLMMPFLFVVDIFSEGQKRSSANAAKFKHVSQLLSLLLTQESNAETCASSGVQLFRCCWPASGKPDHI